MLRSILALTAFILPIFGFDDSTFVIDERCHDRDCRSTSKWTSRHKVTFEVRVSKLKYTHKWAQKYCHSLGHHGKLLHLTMGNLPFALEALEEFGYHKGWVNGASIPDLKDCCGRDTRIKNILLYRLEDGGFRAFPEKPCKKFHAICLLRRPPSHSDFRASHEKNSEHYELERIQRKSHDRHDGRDRRDRGRGRDRRGRKSHQCPIRRQGGCGIHSHDRPRKGHDHKEHRRHPHRHHSHSHRYKEIRGECQSCRLKFNNSPSDETEFTQKGENID